MTNAEARFNKSHIHKVYACLAVTCHLHFWQNDRDFLHATVVTRGWNGYRNKSQHRKSTLEKKILPPFQQGFEPATFQSRVRRSNHWAIPAPLLCGIVLYCMVCVDPVVVPWCFGSTPLWRGKRSFGGLFESSPFDATVHLGRKKVTVRYTTGPIRYFKFRAKTERKKKNR